MRGNSIQEKYIFTTKKTKHTKAGELEPGKH
jgi:hypothetical protein